MIDQAGRKVEPMAIGYGLDQAAGGGSKLGIENQHSGAILWGIDEYPLAIPRLVASARLDCRAGERPALILK